MFIQINKELKQNTNKGDPFSQICVECAVLKQKETNEEKREEPNPVKKSRCSSETETLKGANAHYRKTLNFLFSFSIFGA